MIEEKLELLQITDDRLKVAPKEFDFDSHDAKEYSSVLMRKMIELGGVGLSANQVGLDMKVFTMGIKHPDSGEELRRTLFNPVLIAVGNEQAVIKEGCLSIPGLYLHVKRPTECTMTYTNEEGEEKTETYRGIAARVALHEFDHMLGRNFMHRVSKFKLNRAMTALEKKVNKFNRGQSNVR